MKKFSQDIEEFISEFIKALNESNVAIFAGAGMSVSSGYFDWKKLLEPVARKLQLDINEEHDLTALAQFFVDDKGGRGELNQILIEEFKKADIKQSLNHEILAALPISVYWTTNFDNLIEKALESAGKTPDVKRSQDDLSLNLPKRDAIVYKMHGDVNEISKTVLTKHDYEDYNLSRELFSNAFKTDFVSRTMIFIGFSFTDPNLDYLISRIRSIQLKNKKPDYYFIKEESDEKKLRRQKIRANSLKNYGLRPIWIDSYDKITEILKEVQRRYLRRTVFVSGSASVYGDFGDDGGRSFIQLLAKELSAHGYKIITGFGYGVGTYVINGVLNNMIDRKNKRLDSYISLRPFPLTGKYDTDSIDRKDEYRSEIIKEAGIALFLFGNRMVDGDLYNSVGVDKEFKIAHTNSLKAIPVGLTGFTSKEIWREVIHNYDTYFKDYPELKESIEKLGDTSTSENDVIFIILHILKTLNNF